MNEFNQNPDQSKGIWSPCNKKITSIRLWRKAWKSHFPFPVSPDTLAQGYTPQAYLFGNRINVFQAILYSRVLPVISHSFDLFALNMFALSYNI